MGFLHFILQQTTLPVQQTTEKLTLLDLTIKGGWVMIPIIILAFVATYIFTGSKIIYMTVRLIQLWHFADRPTALPH
jgi:hypothetical protein